MLEEREDQISALNKLSTGCLESHAPTGRVKLTHPILPWMKDPTIDSDRQKLELSQIKSRDTKTQKNIKSTWTKKSNTRKLLKIIGTHLFVRCCHPKILKICRILLIIYSEGSRINHEPSEMNNYFSKLAANLTSKENNKSNLTTLLKNLPQEKYDQSHGFCPRNHPL